MSSSENRSGVRYEANEKPPVALTVGLGLQMAIITVAGIVITPALVVRAAGGGEDFLAWAVFAAVLISGATTILQAVRVGRVGAGYVLCMGTSGAFIAICVTAIAKGGPAMLATLVVVSALFQFVLAARLSLLRRVLTPAVAGTVIMLIPVTVMPIVFDMLTKVPEGSPALAAPVCALATIVAIVGIALATTGAMRLWAPVIGVIAGSLLGGFFGIYDIASVKDAAWIGLPDGSWPGLDLSFGPVFWALLPAFVLVTLIGAIETIGDSVAIQRVSWRRPRAVDFRAVQGAVAADGVGNLLSGIAATVPNTTYSTSVAVTELTGVASRQVGVMLGITFVVLAFIPKALSLVLAIPSPVAAAYVTVLLAMLFVLGMRIVVQDGLDRRRWLIAGVAFWVGVGCQHGMIFPGFLAGVAGSLFDNGMTSGGIVAIVLTLFGELTEPRRRRLQIPFDIAQLPKIFEFLAGFAARSGWGDAMSGRLQAASEETLLSLLGGENKDAKRRLLVTAHREGGGAVLEFIAASGDHNLEDQIAVMTEQPEGLPAEREVSLRLLRNLATSVHHQQYHNIDILTVRVEASEAR